MRLNNKTIKYILIYLILLFIFSLGFVFVNAGKQSPDAIAIRVMPNPNYYSPNRWYREQGFTGSPQSLTVDGYEAIRDGRTTYVNAANISNDKIFTNIYIISYNQNPESTTVDIFGQILKHWKFNTNLTDTPIGECSVSSIVCSTNDDCQDGYRCDNVNNKCILTDKKNCFIDSECPAGLFCSSQKARIIRDVKRLSELVEFNEAIERYKYNNGYYPKLSAGTYLPNKTISTWPSWNEVLGSELETAIPKDTINRLGKCDGFHALTCWNAASSTFAGATDATDQLKLTLPATSTAYVYTAKPDGSKYRLCAVMESGYFTTLPQGACPGSSSNTYENTIINVAPVITCGNLSGLQNSEFIGYVSAYDANNDPLTWTLDTLPNTQWTGWSVTPALQNTDIKNYKKIYATKAGNNGNYNFKITVSDDKLAIASTTCAIKIGTDAVVAIMPIANQITNYCGVLDSTIYASSPANQYPLTFAFTNTLNNTTNELACFEILNHRNCHIKQKVATSSAVTVTVTDAKENFNSETFNLTVDNHPLQITNFLTSTDYIASTTFPIDYTVFKANDSIAHYPLTYQLTGTLPLNFISSFNKNNNIYSYNISNTLATSNSFSTLSTPLPFAVKITNKCGATSTQNFVINVKNNPPVVGNISEQNVRTSHLFSYSVIANDPDGHKLAYTMSGQPTGIAINSSSGLISGTTTPAMVGTHSIAVKVIDEYSASTTKNFIFKVNTYCGDGIIQSPSTEQNINEECEGTNGLAGGWRCLGGETISCSGCKRVCSGGKTPVNCGTGMADINGQVTDYMTAEAILGALIELKDSTGHLIASTTTNTEGNYSFTNARVSAGISPTSCGYRIIVSKQDYANADSGIFQFDSNLVKEFTLGGVGQEGIRIQLTWGEAPPDYDAHLTFEITSKIIHIYYANENEGGAVLDLDDRNGKGPENIRILEIFANTVYTYYINNYSENCTNGTSAIVEIYNQGGVLIKEYSNPCFIGNKYIFKLEVDGDGKIKLVDL